jgi:hypothetical protein
LHVNRSSNRGALEWLLWLGLWGVPFASLACSFLLTLGHDEAWFLIGVRGLVERGVYGGGGVPPAWSSGGAYTLAVAVLSLPSGGSLAAVRLLAVASLALLLWLVARRGARLAGERAGGALAAACVAALPGTAVYAATAHAALPAALLVLAGAFVWGRGARGSRARIAGAGALLGLAAATRWDCALAIPALLVASSLRREQRGRELRDALCASALAAALAAGCVALLVAASDRAPDPIGALLGNLGPELRGAPRANFAAGWRFVPLPLLLLATAAWLWLRARSARDARDLDLLGVFAWLLWLAWLCFAPIPHLRYLWPSLAAFAALLGFGLAAACLRSDSRHAAALRRGALLAGLALLAVYYAGALRAARLGDSDLLSWEWSGEMPTARGYEPFAALRAQRRMAESLRAEIGQDELALVFGLSLAPEYLSRRTLRAPYSLQAGEPAVAELPRKILVTPAFGTYYAVQPAWIPRWMSQNCRLLVRHDGYALYEVTGAFPAGWERALRRRPRE